MNHDSFFKFQNESRIDDSRKFENRAYPNRVEYFGFGSGREPGPEGPEPGTGSFRFRVSSEFSRFTVLIKETPQNVFGASMWI